MSSGDDGNHGWRGWARIEKRRWRVGRRPNRPHGGSEPVGRRAVHTNMDRRHDDRKTRQLCSQVADTLNYVLSGECDDELLQNLQVMSVAPAPNASQLLVTVYPLTASATASDAADIRRRLANAAGRLRAEVAASITRKKAPRLLFQVVQIIG